MRLLFATAAVFLVGCTHDFAQYVPTGDGGTADGASSSDAGADGCTPPQGCFDTATTCGGQCKNQRETCTNQCGGSNTCRNNCFNVEKTCRGTCATTCVTCTTNAACRAESQCTISANK